MEKISVFDRVRLQPFLTGISYLKGAGDIDEKVATESSWKAVKGPEEFDDESSQCLTCGCLLCTRQDQVDHYKSDWHRYNLKVKLNGGVSVSLNEFTSIIDEISSISGSDSDSESQSESENDDKTKLNKALEQMTSIKIEQVEVGESSVGSEHSRSPKIHLKNSEGKEISFYRSIIPKNCEDAEELDVSKLETILLQPVKCLIILFSAGHFAACVYDGEEVIVHKTFHRYVLRAKQGTVQSIRDSKGNAPKSGGASIRRHNEAALTADIQNLLNSWKDNHIDGCTHIFLRAPHYGKGTFYNGKSAPLNRKDPRIKGIPFPTRRPTFNELKRVYKELFSFTINELHENCKFERKQEEIQISKSQRILPVVTEQTDDGSFSITKGDDAIHNVIKTKSSTKKNRKKEEKYKAKDSATDSTTVPDASDAIDDSKSIIDELYTVCKVGNLIGLQAILASIEREFSESSPDCDVIALHLNQPINKDADSLLHISARAGHCAMVTFMLEHGADPSIKNKLSFVPYLVSSDKAMRNTFRKFMAQHPTKYDYKSAQVPSPLTEDMENERKLKLNEKKKAKKNLKKEKMKEIKAEKKKEELEQQEKARFAALSDREKRAVAAERRLAHQLSVQGTSQPSSVKRCWLCGNSLLGKIPFEYFDYQFCSIDCLKKHKSLENISR